MHVTRSEETGRFSEGSTSRFRAKREHHKRLHGLSPESQGQKLALAVLHVPCSLDFFFFFTLVTGPRRSLSLKLSATRVYEPQIRSTAVRHPPSSRTFTSPRTSPCRSKRVNLSMVPDFSQVHMLGVRYESVNDRYSSQFENNYFTEMCSGSEAGSYLRRIDFVYLSTLGLRVIKKKKERKSARARQISEPK